MSTPDAPLAGQAVVLAPAGEIPLSLYVHFPWCVRKCPYCDFNSHGLHGEVPEQDYVAALLRDLDFELQEAPETRPLQSIFFGGGTPSLFSARAISAVLEGVAERIPLAAEAEVTLEANPGTADAANFRGYRKAGINRLSIGVQSFDDAQLKRLGRIHDAAQARRAVDMARAGGFDNLNLDLMFALPQQDVAGAEADLRAALACDPEHLSWYQLTIEPNTAFAKRPPRLPDNDAAWDITCAGQALLEQAGFHQYEVSAYARGGRQCRHNLNYWHFGDYLALGAGAHAKRSFVDAPGLAIRRSARFRSPREYLARAGTARVIEERHEVEQRDRPFEYTMNALRLNAGFELVEFERRSGLPHTRLDPGFRQARGLGLIEEQQGKVRASARGRAHLNTLLELFLP
ncbi:MAG TPA: radical SAM family heme chaperone HemW [Nevskiaceae bacterium]|nr:radical SAM family heme chaperone HemW [Nevskiaceae bacterium]